MKFHSNNSPLISLTIILLLSMSVAFPHTSLLNGDEEKRVISPFVNSLFTSLIRSQIRHRDHYRVSRASSLWKRIGIAGLDNMDAITTTLDRARSRTGPPRMSMRLSMADLRRLMEAGR